MRVVLFDLDDTLFDHQHCSRVGLAAVQEKYAERIPGGPEDLERTYQQLLEQWHRKVVKGLVSLDESRLERFRILLSNDRAVVSDSEARAAAQRFREAYEAAYRAVPGAIELLEQVSAECPVGIVSNHVVAEQIKKMELIGIQPFISELVVSDEVGVPKPNPAIFEVALSRLGGTTRQAVMIGDSWASDIVGATGLGIRAIWLNRYGHRCPDRGLAKEIHGLQPVENLVKVILQP